MLHGGQSTLDPLTPGHDRPELPSSILIFRDVMPQIAHLQYAMAAEKFLISRIASGSRARQSPLSAISRRPVRARSRSLGTKRPDAGAIETGRHVPGGSEQRIVIARDTL